MICIAATRQRSSSRICASLYGFRRPAFISLFILVLVAADAKAFFPEEIGTGWQYSRTGANPPDVVVQLTGEEEVDGKKLLKLERRAGEEITRIDLISVESQGILCHRRIAADGKATAFNPPQLMMPADLKLGRAWELEDEVAGATMRQQWSVVAEEEVIVPAGRFRAYRMRCEQPWPISIAIERWFAPGVGIIKDVTTTRGPTGRLLSRVALALKEPPRLVPIAVASPEPEPSPSATVAPIKITLLLAGERDGVPQTEYRSDAPEIFVWWRGENLPVGSVVRVAWVVEDVDDIAPADFVIDQTEMEVTASEFSARFTLSRPKDGWAAGKYRAELYLEEELREKVNVTIVD